MENKTRFDLNTAVESWRQELAAQPSLATDERRELETHLRDALAELKTRGLNDEESFWLACRRVGQPQKLAEEFVKGDPAKVWRERVFWMALAVLVVWLWNGSFVFASGLGNNFAINSLQANEIKPATFWWLVSSPYSFLRMANLLIHVLPICGLALLLAKGGIDTNSKLISIFNSRSRIVITASICAFINSSVTVWRGWGAAHFPGLNKPIIPYLILENYLASLVFPMALIALLVWLMPSQNRKTPRTT